MQIDWAVYAAEDQSTQTGHRWRQGSVPVIQLPDVLKGFTDLPANANTQTLTPYFGGRAFPTHFALTYTEPNASEGRAGRVRTRVLWFPHDAEILNIEPLLDALTQPELFEAHQKRIEVHGTQDQPQPHPGVRVVLDAFVQARGKRVVWVGGEEKDLLSGLWAALPPAARTQFSFRRHFAPLELPAAFPQLILGVNKAPWEREKDPLLAHPREQVSVVARALTGEPLKFGQAVADAFQGSVLELASLNALLAALESVQGNKRSIASLQYAITLLQNTPLNPGFKAVSLEEHTQLLLHAIPDASDQDVRMLKGLAHHPPALEQAVAAWMQKHLFEGSESAAFLRLLKDPSGWFNQAVAQGLKAVNPQLPYAKGILEGPLSPEEQRFVLEELNPSWDEVLFRTMEAAQKLSFDVGLAVRKGWWRVHALLMSVEPAPVALQAVLQQTPETLQAHCLRILADHYQGADWLQALVAAAHPSLRSLAARTLRQDPSLLSHIDPQNLLWLDLWAESLSSPGEVFRHIPDPHLATQAVMQHVLNGQKVPTRLLEAISTSTHASLLDHPSRSRLLPHLPQGFLVATAKAYLSSVRDPGPMDSTLQRAVLQNLRSTPSVAAAIRIADLAHHLTSTQFSLVIKVLAGASEGKTLARKLSKKKPKTFFEDVANFFGFKTERPIPDELHEDLSPFEKVLNDFYGKRTVKPEEWWRAVYDIVPETAKEGPNSIIIKLGQEKLLPKEGSNEDRWIEVLSKIRGGSPPRIKDVLEELQKKYRNEDKISLLIKTNPDRK